MRVSRYWSSARWGLLVTWTSKSSWHQNSSSETRALVTGVIVSPVPDGIFQQINGEQGLKFLLY